MSNEQHESNQFEISNRQQITINTHNKLLLAAKRGDLETVKFLIDEKQQKTLQKDEHGKTGMQLHRVGV